MPYDPSAGNVAAEPAETVDPAAPSPTPPPASAEELGIGMSAENVTATGLTLVLERIGEGPLCMTGTPFHLERQLDDRWVEVERIPYEGEGVLAWEDIGWLFPDEVGGRYEHPVSWRLLYGELAPGQYRMVKTADSAVLYAEFEITE